MTAQAKRRKFRSGNMSVTMLRSLSDEPPVLLTTSSPIRPHLCKSHPRTLSEQRFNMTKSAAILKATLTLLICNACGTSFDVEDGQAKDECKICDV